MKSSYLMQLRPLLLLSAMAALSPPKRLARKLAVAVAMLFATAAATAYTVPAVGDFGYDFYDIFVLKGTSGAPGFVAAAILGALAIAALRTQWIMAVMCVMGAAVVVKLEDILVTLGAVVA